VRLGTRGSPLALAQARAVADLLGGAEVVAVESRSGERGPAGDKGRFVRGVERALLDGEVDIGVHSAKDVPGDLPDGLEIAGVPAREDPADAYVGPAESLDEVPEGARVGTSSLRRRSQLLAIRPDLEIVDLRGNVDTRLEKLAGSDVDGAVLALAGLHRLGREDDAAFAIDPDLMTPAPGQGALALEVRSDDREAAAAAASVTDPAALAELTAERAVVTALDASCRTPMGALARLRDGRIELGAFVGLPDGSEWVRDRLAGDAADPAAVGREVAERLLAAGAGEILERAEVAA
jgi:hydroxymethylbilane synthase